MLFLLSPGRDGASLTQEGRDLLVGREALRRELREHRLPFPDHLERAALRLDELDLRTGERRLQLGGQTDRLRLVVSLHAVLDHELHATTSDPARL